jgi:uroporphyrinogen decarboxylase
MQGGYMSIWLIYSYIRGLEQSMIDMVAYPEITDYILGKITDFYIETHTALLDATDGLVDIVQVTDDFGSQSDIMISLDMFDRFFRKHYERMIKMVKSYGCKVFHHDDGAIMKIVPYMVDMGMDILNPIQWHLPGMDLDVLKKQYGDKLCFHGAIDNQDVLPFGTVADVRKEVTTCIEKLASDGTGFILAPCHNVQVITPTENFVEMYKTVNEIGYFR